MGKMLPNSGESATQIVALQPVPLGDGPHDRPQSGIMAVRNIWEKVMLNLVVKPAGEPRGKARGRGEVGRGADLMRSPIVSCTNPAELHFLCKMGKLEDRRQHPAENEMK